MVAGSILPVTLHNNKLYFLFGKENPMEQSSKGWSDFGGGCEDGETPYETALREGGEELTGFLGDSKKIEKMIKQHSGIYKIVHNDYHVHLFFIDYDENLPKYYNNNHLFLWERMNKNTLNNSKLFEKIEIDWFSIKNIENRKGEFRNFYQEIIVKILSESKNIRKFINKKENRKTRKNKNER
jgi:8-oxo-dGTP pyrophosphatase MutT (NUDIX family)